MSTLRANTLKPITSGNSLVLQGDSGGSGVTGIEIDSTGKSDFNGKELILDVDGDTSITADTDDQIDFRAGGSDSVKIGNEHLTINDGNLVIGTAGHGITFGGDPDSRVNSPTTGNRTLYDYEEGYFNPSVDTSSLDSDSDTLSYTKIGRVVYIQGRLNFASTGAATDLNIGNLPFVIGTTSTLPDNSGTANILVHFTNLSSAILRTISVYFATGTSFRVRDGGNGTTTGNQIGDHIDSDTQVYISGFYFVD